MKVAVILGGTSAERDVSLITGISVARALHGKGYEVEAIDCAYGERQVDFLSGDESSIIRSIPPDIEKEKKTLDQNIFKTIDYLVQKKFTVVFNALHGGYGENGQLAALLDLAQIPYTGSGTLASAIGLDKHLAKLLFRSQQVPTAEWEVLTSAASSDNLPKAEKIGTPLVVKPNQQGSTVGLTILKELEELDNAVKLAFQYDQRVLLEQYIPGKELTVSILGKTPLPVIEIIPQSGFYDYKAKYQAGETRYIVPAELPAEMTRKLQDAALKAYNALECCGYARVDFRLQDDQQFFCLEVNTLPGMTPTSLVPKAAKATGIEFPDLIEKIIALALKTSAKNLG